MSRPSLMSPCFVAGASIVFAGLSNVPGTHAFSAKLSPPWTGAPHSLRDVTLQIVYDDGGFRRRRRRRGRRSSSSSSASSATERDEVNEEDDVGEEDDDPNINSSDFPNSASTERAYREFRAAETASLCASSISLPTPGGALGSHPNRNLSSTSLGASASDTQDESDPPPAVTVRSCLGPLFRMTRPTNFPGVLLFHALGVHRALSAGLVAPGGTVDAAPVTLLSTLQRPQMIIVAVALLLTSATSMVVNDYYDARSGVDARNALAHALASHSSTDASTTYSGLDKPLATGAVPMVVAKRFLSYLYAVLLLCLVAVPGIPARLTVAGATMLTFWYTQHLKPRTWLKNVSCASIIALSPFTSGSAALNLALGDAASIRPAFGALWRLVLTLFAGFMSREILMDICDYEGDKEVGVRTVPVKYGRRFASRVSLVFATVMGALTVGGPAMGLASAWDGALAAASGTSAGGWAAYASAIGALARTPMARKFLLGAVGGGLILRRAWMVARTEGNDLDLTGRAIDEQKEISFLFVLASFI